MEHAVCIRAELAPRSSLRSYLGLKRSSQIVLIGQSFSVDLAQAGGEVTSGVFFKTCIVSRRGGCPYLYVALVAVFGLTKQNPAFLGALDKVVLVITKNVSKSTGCEHKRNFEKYKNDFSVVGFPNHPGERAIRYLPP